MSIISVHDHCSSPQHACVECSCHQTSTIKVEEGETDGRSFVSPDGGASPKDKLLHVLVFTILFLNILSLEHTVFLVSDETPACIASFHVMVGTVAATQHNPESFDPVLVEVYTHNLICWDAKISNTTASTLSPVTSAAGCQYIIAPSPPQRGHSASLIRFTTVILAVWLGYNILPLVERYQREFGNKIMCRLATFSAFCALLALAANLKVLHNASQQAARLTFRQQDGNGVNYLPEIAPLPMNKLQLVPPIGWYEVSAVFSILVLFLSIFAASQVAPQYRLETLAAIHFEGCPDKNANPTKKTLMVVCPFLMCTWLALLPCLHLLLEA